MTSLGVAQIGLEARDDHRLRTIVGMATIAGHVGRWRVCSPAEADLLVVAPDHPDAQAALGDRAAFPRATFAALLGAADVPPPDCIRLSWPIRNDEVIRLLTSVKARAGAAASLSVEDGLLRLAFMLRSPAQLNDPELVWRVSGASDRPIYVAPAARTFFHESPLAQLRSVSPSARLTFDRLAAQAIPQSLTPRPLSALQWTTGDLLGQSGLLPWIDPTAALRMKRWPNFTALEHDPRHRRLAALLMERVDGVPELLRLARQEAATVHGFVNAASLCGYLASDLAPAPMRAARPKAASRSLLHRLRGALGIREKG